ncbi:unnamed protein product [Anisakis simplex]|uniref:Lysine-specific demethylase rbr-2 (inferred by orthology to a C. elegans protein) n=1 Tax=Anisakis simplex TaxID=6269 RepID=A0A0M3K5Z6_ANISI|nr:unnamed protein product [Anisakis simplex]
MNRSYEKFYRHFERPPFAPTYYPSEEEFVDPISYIAKIKPEAERYGVVKIKPPPSFHPPFAIDSEHFEFTPRVQKLNQIDGLVRSKLIFDTELTNFWHLKGQPLHIPCIENKYVDLFRLSRDVYKLSETEEEANREECVKSMQGRRRAPEPRTKSMAGLRHPITSDDQIRNCSEVKKVKSFDPMDEVMCKKCGRGDDEKCLLLCEDCDYSLHTYCCEPPLNNVPKGSTVGSGFPMPGKDFSQYSDAKERERYSNHPWNLNVMPVLRESVLSHIDTGISGMMVPWVYVGMCFSAFCWHTEDHWTYSVNYMHRGERKIWYGVSGLDGQQFDDVVKTLVPDLFEKQPDLLHHMTTTINPALLIQKGVKVYSVHQEPGEFVITFPRAYHAGYNEGLNVAEAVNFAPADWLCRGWLCIADYARVRRNCVFSFEELIVRMAKNASALSVVMCLAAYEQMHKICSRESNLRKCVAEMGVDKTSRELYENIADDLRSCAVCRTTLFMSGLQCKHERLVCLEHADRLCSKCQPSDLTLKYRYTLDELVPFMTSLQAKTKDYVEWREKMSKLLDAQPEHKPSEHLTRF